MNGKEKDKNVIGKYIDGKRRIYESSKDDPEYSEDVISSARNAGKQLAEITKKKVKK